MQSNPYLHFQGNCAQALEFYKSAIGAVVDAIMPYSAMPPMPSSEDCPPFDVAAMADKIMHASFRIGSSVIMAGDSPPVYAGPFSGFALTLAADTAEDAAAVFAALSEGGEVTMPLGETFFAEKYGQLTDKFGVSWMVIFEGSKKA